MWFFVLHSFSSDKLPQSQLAFWKTFVRLSWGWGGKATWLVSLKALYLLTLKVLMGFNLVSRYNIPSTCFKTSNKDLLGLQQKDYRFTYLLFEPLRGVVLWGFGPFGPNFGFALRAKNFWFGCSHMWCRHSSQEINMEIVLKTVTCPGPLLLNSCR